MRKYSGCSIPRLPKKINMLGFFFFLCGLFFLPAIDISVDFKRNVRTVRVWCCLKQRREMVSCKLGRLKCSVVNMAVHEWSCLSGLAVDEFQDLLTQSGQVLKAKTFNRCVILLVGSGWPDTYEKNYEMRIGSLPLWWNGRITQNSFWAWARQLKKHETGPHRIRGNDF